MRLGQHMKWESLDTPGKWFTGQVMCFENDLDGWAIVQYDDDPSNREIPIRRKRLVPFTPPASKTAKGGGDDSAPSGVLIAEAA